MSVFRDISMTIREGMVIYPGDPGVRIMRVSRIEDGKSANLSEYRMGSHTGTHVDPPFHFDPAGEAVDRLPLESLIGPAVVVEAPGDVIDAAFLMGQRLEDERRVLFKTKNSAFLDGPPFREDFAHLTPDAAMYLVGLGVVLVGMDYLSIEAYRSPDHAVHHELLGAGAVIVEGLDLSGVPPGRYELICLPLKVAGGDGSPARAVLRELT